MKPNDNQKTTGTQNIELSPTTQWSVQGSNLRPPVYKGIGARGVTPTTLSREGQKSPQKARQVAETPKSYDNDKTTVVLDVASARDRIPPHLQFTVWSRIFA